MSRDGPHPHRSCAPSPGGAGGGHGRRHHRRRRARRRSTRPTPASRERLFDDAGKLRRFVNVFVADEDVRFLDGLDTAVADGQTVSIVPAVAGG